MRTEIKDREVEAHNVGQTSNFTIKANGKAFKVLIDGLYSDKIRAAVREIWSNAFDAHVAAGCADKPFDCQLPTQFDPVFRVRDYGTGMGHDTVMHVYTRVFESSKEDTNAQVGKLGLGSKSPFAYTDSFTVTAFDGIEKRVYSAFIGKDYVPQIALMARTPSEEPRGIEIQFPAKTIDVSAFTEAAIATARGFDVLPNIMGGSFQIKPLETIMSGDGWKIIKNDSVYGLRAHAKQGCVVYPLDPNALDHISSFERAILSSPFFIDFPIGDLEISASRENLGYDDTTKANIRARIAQIGVDIIKRYQSEIDDAPTMWQACRRFNKLMKSDLHRGVLEILRACLTYKGKPLKPKKDLTEFLSRYFHKTFEQGGVRAMIIDSGLLNKGRYERNRSIKFDHSTYIQVAAGETTVIFDDADKPASVAQGRIRHWYSQLPSDERGDVLWVKARRTGTAFKRLLIELGRPTGVIELASLEKPPVEVNSFETRRPTKVKVLEQQAWVETEIDENSDIIFVELSRHNTLDHSGAPGATPGRVDTAVKLLKSLGYLDEDVKVYGIPQTHKAKIAVNEHWTSLWALAQQAVREKYDANRASSARAYNNKMREYSQLSEFMKDLVKRTEFTGFRGEQSPADKLYGKWLDVATKAAELKDHENAITLHVLLGGALPILPEIDFTADVKAFEEAYPLINVLFLQRSIINYETRQHILNYINLVDAATAFRQSDTVSLSEAA